MHILISDLDDTLFDTTGQLDDTYSNLSNINSFEGARELLSLPRFKYFLVTAGESDIQAYKLEILKLRGFFDDIYICRTNAEKQDMFKKIIQEHGTGTNLNGIFVIGNRIDSEIRYGNELGLTTILLSHGKYADVKPLTTADEPDYTVPVLSEAIQILKNLIARQTAR